MIGAEIFVLMIFVVSIRRTLFSSLPYLIVSAFQSVFLQGIALDSKKTGESEVRTDFRRTLRRLQGQTKIQHG